jgi:peroxiredoxin Q/BCP
MVSVGDKAPEFCLPDQDNNKNCLKDYKGKWVILYFYPKDNTSGCTLEAKDFTCALDEFNKLNAIVIGVSPDSIDSHQKFISKQSLNLTLLSDMDHKALEKYGVWQLKKMYGREYYGVVRSTFLIDPKGKIGHVWSKVKVKGHVGDVKNILIEKQK